MSSRQIKCEMKNCLYASKTQEFMDNHMNNFHAPGKWKWCSFCGYATKVQKVLNNHKCPREEEYKQLFNKKFDQTKDDKDDTDLESDSDSITRLNLNPDSSK